ncbi:hypothetical protein LTR85_003921 [Meristemomyces frigidus]|nr:hypothetical protein LTR85_003921 [Meristemomyces frigidus]
MKTSVVQDCGAVRKVGTVVLLKGAVHLADLCAVPALPAVFAHCDLIRIEAMVMSIIGGLLINGTIISFTMFFHEQEEF